MAGGENPPVTRVRLIHQNPAQAARRLLQLESAGYSVEYSEIPDSAAMRQLAEQSPDVYLIDLERLPSHGREIGLWLRRRKTSRRIPLLFVGGAPAKVGRVRGLLPDAAFCAWNDVAGAIADAVANPPADPVVPASQMAGYSGTPLPKKLGIKDGTLVALIDPPPDFDRTLGRLPRCARLVRNQRPDADLTIWFCRTQVDLDARIASVRERLPERGRLWIAWPKQSSGLTSDLRQAGVRAAGLGNGLVDFKICAIDETWSGLQFAPRRG